MDAEGICAECRQPVMRLRAKTVLPAGAGRPARVRRRFDAAQTPFDRLAATGILAPKQQAQLQALRAATNPRAVRQQSYALLDQSFALLLSLPGSTQDVCLTLFDSPTPTKGGGDPGNIIKLKRHHLR